MDPSEQDVGASIGLKEISKDTEVSDVKTMEVEMSIAIQISEYLRQIAKEVRIVSGFKASVITELVGPKIGEMICSE